MSKPILLIADDEEMNRTVISKFFKHDYEVLTAANGREALQMIEQEQVDLLILDIIMPEMDGMEVLEKIRQDRSYDAMGILVATSAKEKTERQALSDGADDIVSKPYDPIVIRKRLSNITAKKQIEQQIQNGTGFSPQYSKEMHTVVKKMKTIAYILKENSQNQKLVEDCTEKLQDEISRLEHQLTSGEQGE